MNTYLIIQTGDVTQALFLDQMVRFEANPLGSTDVYMTDHKMTRIPVDFMTFCIMVNNAKAAAGENKTEEQVKAEIEKLKSDAAKGEQAAVKAKEAQQRQSQSYVYSTSQAK
jgi:hypothetical protein